VDQLFAGHDYVFDLQIGNAAYDEVAAALVWEASVLTFNGPVSLAPQADF